MKGASGQGPKTERFKIRIVVHSSLLNATISQNLRWRYMEIASSYDPPAEVRPTVSGKKHPKRVSRDGSGRPPGTRMRRGDIRDLLLAALIAGPAHGYELMRRLEDQAAGQWRPSPGSVYPCLQLLEDEGLITGKEEGGRKVYELTVLGKGQADDERLRELTADETALEAMHREIREATSLLQLATKQVAVAGDQSQLERAVAILRGARQALYLLLAED